MENYAPESLATFAPEARRTIERNIHLITEGKKGLLKISYVTTDKIHGYEIDNDTIDELIQARQAEFDTARNWLLSKEAIHEGLNWSIEKIKKSDSYHISLMAGERLSAGVSLRSQVSSWPTGKCFETATSHMQNLVGS